MVLSKKYNAEFLMGKVFYNPVTGEFFGRSGRKLTQRIDHRGYMRISVYGVGDLISHRVAWVITTGESAPESIDHIDGNKANNIFSNLRKCTHTQNQHNQGLRKTNKSGFKGVSWMKSVNKWQAQICCNSKVKHLGLFTDKIDAARAYDAAAIELHGEFARTNFK